MALAVIALGAIAFLVYSALRSPLPKTAAPLDPYTEWMSRHVPRLRNWRR
jgi:hypothetical protein